MGVNDRNIFSSVINLDSVGRADIQRLSDLHITSSSDPKVATIIDTILFTPSYYTSFKTSGSTF